MATSRKLRPLESVPTEWLKKIDELCGLVEDEDDEYAPYKELDQAVGAETRLRQEQQS